LLLRTVQRKIAARYFGNKLVMILAYGVGADTNVNGALAPAAKPPDSGLVAFNWNMNQRKPRFTTWLWEDCASFMVLPANYVLPAALASLTKAM
jgi:hypothetical protein